MTTQEYIGQIQKEFKTCNSKKKEVCPDGSKDENVFDIMQGVSINILLKKGNS